METIFKTIYRYKVWLWVAAIACYLGVICHLDTYMSPNGYSNIEYAMTKKNFLKVYSEVLVKDAVNGNHKAFAAMALTTGVHFIGIALLSGILMEFGRAHMNRFAPASAQVPQWMKTHAKIVYALGWLFIPFYTSLHSINLSMVLDPTTASDNKTRGASACSIISLSFIGFNVLSVFFFRIYIFLHRANFNEPIANGKISTEGSENVV